MMRYLRFPTKAQASIAAGREIAKTVIENPRRRIGLATGNTVISIYAAMIAGLQLSGISLKDLVTYNLDEWGFEGQFRLPRTDIRTFEGFMYKHLFNQLVAMGFDPSRNAHFPSFQIGLEQTLRRGMDLSAYDEQIAQDGGVDTWLIGAGADTPEHRYQVHVAFAERGHLLHLGDDWTSRNAYTDLLEPDTIQNNKGYEGCDGDASRVPNLAITVSPGTLLRQVKRRVIFAAFGPAKPGSLFGACELPPHAGCSASVVQLLDEAGIDVDVYMDPESASLLQRKERFVEVDI